MVLIVMVMAMYGFICGSEPFNSPVLRPEQHQRPPLVINTSMASEDSLCDKALTVFMENPRHAIADHIRPHLVHAIRGALQNNEEAYVEHDDSPSPDKTMRSWLKSADAIDRTPRSELDKVVLSAVQKAFEEKEAQLQKKTQKIESMFSKKVTAAISSAVGIVIALAGTLGGIYGNAENNNCNCTK